jgi:hypothetical protein
MVTEAAHRSPPATDAIRKFEVSMAAPRQRTRRHPNWERVRENGKFVRDPGKLAIAEPHPTRHTTAYRQMRNMALRLMRHLERMMPPLEKDEPDDRAENQPESTDSASATKAEVLHPAYERLLGRSDGVIDGFNTLALLVIRLSDKERESRGQPQKTSTDLPKIDEDELDRRIVAELDFIARRRGTATPA